ncbi:SusC/RagA family TonB-linked outer membrane protein [Dinghuibacter silviterrae]|uniref:TonB-linked SusC/RagA family outer membrane protein n=1 Tax=Dinghuibacter silviterrae TaxID=1539049 RepID=A0A4R8DJ25_9BACT|nr:TonB-dependent receptor [Dinghuibacter silviterrae]TDW97585.1 TonB-linked SusC/RagA family outer membrane protein [Dinghuibacter silviterrae]
MRKNNDCRGTRPGIQLWKSLPGRLLSLVLLACVLAAGQVWGQNASPRTIEGRVLSKSGEPVVGANIQVRGSKVATATDANGKFNIYARIGDVLDISAVGYRTQRVTIGAEGTVRIAMETDFGHMDDVVVVGYGQMKRTDLSSAQTTVTSKDIGETVNTTLDQALQGRAAGVYVSSPSGQPGAGANVVIRGISSITAGTQPLYVIDGVQIRPGDFSDDPNSHPTGFANALSGINPDDIESMNILEGPAATAIFGAAGANGVIMITTKHGKAGDTKISASTTWTIQDKPKELPVMNLQQYATFRNDAAAAGGAPSDPSFANPSVLGPGTDWQAALYRRTLLQKHTLSLSGGNDKTTFYLSGEYFSQEGVAPGSGFNRASTRINLDNKVRPWLKLGLNLNPSYTTEKVNTTNAGIVQLAVYQNPSVPVKNPDGTWAGPVSTQYQYTNPVALSYINNDYNKGLGVIGGGYVDLTPIKGLTIHTEANTNLNYTNNYQFHPSYQFGGYVNATTVAYVNTYNSWWWNWHSRIQYDTKIGLHSISVMAGHEAQAYGGGALNGQRQDYVTNSIQDLSGGAQATSIANSTRYDGAQESYFGRLNYVYNDRYILGATLRADGSSNFGPDNRWGYFPSVSVAWRISQENFMKNIKSVNDLKLRFEVGTSGNSAQTGGGYYAALQSVPTAWGTGFLSSNFSNLKLKWESDKTYNVGVDLHMFNNRIELIADAYKKYTTNLLTQSVYPFYDGGDIAYSAGYIQWPEGNVGSMWNKGLTVTLNTVNFATKQFQWKTGFNISFDKNQVTYLPTPYITSWNSTQAQFQTVAGQPLSMITGYIAQGLFKNYADITSHAVQTANGVMTVSPQGTWVGDIKFKDLNKDNVINASDRTTIGNPWPKYTFGFNNEFTYKGFDLNVLVIGSIGNDILNYFKYYNTIPLDNGVYGNYLKATAGYARPSSYNIADSSTVTLTNPGGTVPRIAPGDPNGNNRMSNLWVENGSYVRVKNVALSYVVPTRYLGHMPIRGLRVGVNVQNLFTITKYSGYDPEIGIVKYQGVNMVGIDTGRYPNVRMYTGSMVLDF